MSKEELWINGWDNGIHSKRVFTFKLFKYRLELWRDFDIAAKQTKDKER